MESREIVQREAEFKSLVREAFGFLITEFGFDPAMEEDGEWRYRLIFRCPQTGQVVEVLNAFHGYDYGFEVNIYSLGDSTGEMIYYRLKENQDAGFSFVSEGARKLQNTLQNTAGLNCA